MAINHRIHQRTKLKIHDQGGSVTDLRYYHPRGIPNGGEIHHGYGNKLLLIGIVGYTPQGYMGWRVTMQVEGIRHVDGFISRLVYYPLKRKRLMDAFEARNAFNPHTDVVYVGSAPSRSEAEEMVIEAYETKFETVVAA